MVTVRIRATITDDRKLVVDLPDNLPAGPVEVVIEASDTGVVNSLRESARAKLAAAGRLGQAHLPSPGMYEPTEAEILTAGTLPPGARPTHELIAEDRDES